MRFHHTLARIGLLLLGVRCVEASTKANPWQFVMWYYAYRTHMLVYGNTNTWFAPCASATSADGICTFDEFAEFIRKKFTNNYGTVWPVGTVDGLGVEPEPKLAVDQINTLSDDIKGRPQDVMAIFPGETATWSNPKATYKFPPQIEKLNMYMQYLRQHVYTTSNIELEDDPRYKTSFGYFQDALEGVVEMRRYDMWTLEMPKVLSNYAAKGITPVKKTVSANSDGGETSWTEIDTDKTRAVAPSFLDAIQPITDVEFVDSTGSSHWKVVETFDKIRSYMSISMADFCDDIPVPASP